jgi:hypothetical protein
MNLLTTEAISQETETELTDDISCRRGDFETRILRRGQCTCGRINVSDHSIGKIDCKKIVRVGITTINSGAFMDGTIQHRRQ